MSIEQRKSNPKRFNMTIFEAGCIFVKRYDNINSLKVHEVIAAEVRPFEYRHFSLEDL